MVDAVVTLARNSRWWIPFHSRRLMALVGKRKMKQDGSKHTTIRFCFVMFERFWWSDEAQRFGHARLDMSPYFFAWCEQGLSSS